MPKDVPFHDRSDAGQRLAAALADRPRPDVVLALPRGGVPVAFEIAIALKAPLDLLMVRKIPAPGLKEFGIGAVVDGSSPQVVLNDHHALPRDATQDYIGRQVAQNLKEIERRRRVYLGDRAPLPVKDRTVVLADDGIATGGTALAGLRALRQAGARFVTLAVPVAPPEAIARLKADADAVVCLETPSAFQAVGQFYDRFDQTADETVVSLIARAAEAFPL